MATEPVGIPSTPVMVDYTSRDFYALRENLIARVRDRVTNWAGDDPADFGIALIEAFAYMGDIISYYTDRVANESRLTTATQRENVLSLARSYGYVPSGYQSASATLFIENASASSITLPQNTQLVGRYQEGNVTKKVTFYTSADTTISAKTTVNGTESVGSRHGELISLRYTNDSLADGTTDIPGLEQNGNVAGESLGTSSGSTNQKFVLSENQVVQDSVEIWVENGPSSDIYALWTQVDNLIDANPTDTVYSTVIDANNFVSVYFGDGVSGMVPPNGATIKAKYVVGGGTDGNVPSNMIFILEKIPGQPLSKVSEWNAVLDISVEDNNGVGGSGGLDPESDTVIRNGALEFLRSSSRAVTIEDYRRLALGVPGVGKSGVSADVWSSINLYVAPPDGTGYPLYGSSYPATPNSEWTTLKDRVETFIEGKELVGATVTVLPPTYKDVRLSIEYVKREQYLDYQVQSAIRAILKGYYSYARSNFGQIIYPEDIEFILRATPGVLTARVTELYVNGVGSAGDRSTLVGAANEIFMFALDDETKTKVNNESGISALAGTLTGIAPTFTPNTTAYDFTTVASSTKTLLLTYSANATVLVTATGGSVTIGATTGTLTKTTTYTFAIGVSAITVVVSSRGGLSTTTYTFS
jgi:hypothetical protein